MGFPTWTLWGMALATLGALLAITLSFIGQSPRAARRFGLVGFRLDLRVRALTGYGLALLLVALGFFLAGVPLGETTAVSPTAAAALPTPSATPLPALVLSPTATTAVEATVGSAPSETPRLTPETGAFDVRPPTATLEGDELIPPTATPTADSTENPSPGTPATSRPPTVTPTPSLTPTITAMPTLLPTATATATATPTLTPTPIDGQTAVIDVGSSTLWVRRTPGGSRLALLLNGDRVIVLGGHANQGGRLWQEVSTLDGQVGWVLFDFLNFDTS